MLTDPCWAVLWMFTRDAHPELWRSHFSKTLIEEALALVLAPRVGR